MSDNKRQMNPLLLLIAILLCLSAGFLFHRTSFDSDYQIPDRQIFKTKNSQITPTPATLQKSTPKPSAAPSVSASVTPAITSVQEKASPEASTGIWTANGSNWLFMVNDVPYTGWLIDTDGKHYFFDKDGIMQTGWLDDNGKRYYLDQDGIMQTGIITIDGKNYDFQSDGSLKK